MINSIIVILWFTGALIVAAQGKFGQESTALLTLLGIDTCVAFIMFLITRYKSKMCMFTLLILFAINFLLFLNTVQWSTRNMEGAFYYVPFLKHVTNLLYSTLFFSAFSLMIPMMLYALFLFSLTQVFCKYTTTKDLDTLEEYFRQKEIKKKE